MSVLRLNLPVYSLSHVLFDASSTSAVKATLEDAEAGLLGLGAKKVTQAVYSWYS
jgi:hypothetical protein